MSTSLIVGIPFYDLVNEKTRQEKVKRYNEITGEPYYKDIEVKEKFFCGKLWDGTNYGAQKIFKMFDGAIDIYYREYSNPYGKETIVGILINDFAEGIMEVNERELIHSLRIMRTATEFKDKMVSIYLME